MAAEWDNRQPPDRQAILDKLLSRFDAYIQNADMVLEVGTGTGGLLPLLKKRYPKPDIIQIDFASAMLQCAQRKHYGDHLVQADVHDLPFLTRKFSAVICHNSFPHFKEKGIALREMQRVLQPGGVLLILHELNREKVNFIHRHALAMEIHRDLLPSGKEIRKLLQQAEFASITIEDCEDHYAICARV